MINIRIQVALFLQELPQALHRFKDQRREIQQLVYLRWDIQPVHQQPATNIHILDVLMLLVRLLVLHHILAPPPPMEPVE